MRRLAVGALAVAVVALFPCVAAAATFTVSGTTDPGGAGCSGTTCQSLRAAVAAATQPANLGSTVQLDTATYTLAGGPLTIGADVTIVGTGAPGTTIEQGTPGDTVIVISSPTAHVTLSGVDITGASATGNDAVGGVLDEGSLTLTNDDINGNTATGSTGVQGTNVEPGSGGQAVGGIEVTAGASLAMTGGEISGDTAVGGIGGNFQGNITTLGGAPGGNAIGALAIDAGAGAVSISGINISSDTATGGTGGDDNNNGGLNGSSGSATAIDDQSSSAVSIATATINSDISTGGNGRNASGDETGADGGNVVGGAIYDSGGPMAVSDSSLVGDHGLGGTGGSTITSFDPGSGGVAEGGAIAITGSGALTLVRSTLVEDDATGGNAGPLNSGSVAPHGGDGGIALGGALFLFGSGHATLVNDTLGEDEASGGAHSVVETGASSPATAGANGAGYGGAISDQSTAAATTLALASDTIEANVATSLTSVNGLAGNLDIGASSWSISDTVVAGGTASGGDGSGESNCAIGEAPSDGGHNLEDTTPAQCGLSTADHDLIGVAPQLGALTAASGTTLATYAPQPASPLRGAGGSCTDPSQSGNPALATDERGAPRHSSCDIGAYETEPPSGTIALSGSTAAGSVLSCPTSAIHGDAPLTFATPHWLANGQLVATSATFSVSSAVAGTTLSCTVAATNQYGAITVTSNGLAIPSTSTTTTTQTPGARFKGATLVSRTLHVFKGRIALVVACPATIPGGVCHVTATIRSGKRTLGHAGATVRAGKHQTLLVAVAHAERTRVRRRPGLAVIVTLTTRDSAGATASSSPHGKIAPPGRN